GGGAVADLHAAAVPARARGPQTVSRKEVVGAPSGANLLTLPLAKKGFAPEGAPTVLSIPWRREWPRCAPCAASHQPPVHSGLWPRHARPTRTRRPRAVPSAAA